MERKLKFRVWTGNGMEYSVVVGEYGVFYVNPENGTGLDPRDTASLTPNNTKYHDDTPVMQYSGLNDKNGREIYEGDVLQDRQGMLTVVKFRYGCFFACLPDDDEEVMTSDACDFHNLIAQWENATDKIFSGDISLTIVGNIYENPEILK